MLLSARSPPLTSAPDERTVELLQPVFAWALCHTVYFCHHYRAVASHQSEAGDLALFTDLSRAAAQVGLNQSVGHVHREEKKEDGHGDGICVRPAFTGKESNTEHITTTAGVDILLLFVSLQIHAQNYTTDFREIWWRVGARPLTFWGRFRNCCHFLQHCNISGNNSYIIFYNKISAISLRSKKIHLFFIIGNEIKKLFGIN